MTKKILVVTGPQGSGNHAFAKIFSSHPRVGGWKSFLTEKWQGHHHEPFAPYWQDPSKLTSKVFEEYDYWAASVSTPYVGGGEVLVPKIREFCERCNTLGLEVVILIISRDQNIVSNIQQRVRGRVTVDMAKHLVADLVDWAAFPIHFVSLEGLSLYRGDYLKNLGRMIDFPVRENVDAYQYDTNRNYVNQIDKGEFDELILGAIEESSKFANQ